MMISVCVLMVFSHPKNTGICDKNVVMSVMSLRMKPHSNIEFGFFGNTSRKQTQQLRRNRLTFSLIDLGNKLEC